MSRWRRDQRFGVFPVGYTQVATLVLFDSATLLLNGEAGSTVTDIARVYDQYGALMNPQTGTITYSSGSPGVATVSSSTGVITSVGNGDSVITASWYA